MNTRTMALGALGTFRGVRRFLRFWVCVVAAFVIGLSVGTVAGNDIIRWSFNTVIGHDDTQQEESWTSRITNKLKK